MTANIELILAALAAGATAGATSVATTAVQDTYNALRAAIRERLPFREAELLDAHEVESDAWRVDLAEALAEVGASSDQEILRTARELLVLTGSGSSYQLDLREAKGVQVGDGNTQHNTFS
ncbi:hypothetical protein [Polymorphospora rubra]|uniref:hypothetical protein n=1 Tax=Polymorphospora rubra TaxID=338584 RepID=UPI0033C694EB